MRILATGLLIFACWASLSTWLYVCKIRGLCNERGSITVSTSEVSNTSTSDSLAITPEAKSVTPEMKPVAPEMLLVYFEFDKSSFAIDSGLSAFSDATISYMSRHSESGLVITGHTDNKGSVDYNQALGYRRAQSIKNYFESNGVAAGKITIVSKGENEPVENNSTDKGRAKNRRASISVITNK
ncbi:MAG: OmpA family protein [Bacteroidales bacterium]